MKIRIRAGHEKQLYECFDCHSNWKTRDPIWTQICPHCHSHNIERMS